MIRIFVFIALWGTRPKESENSGFKKVSDSLRVRDYDYLFDRIEQYSKDSVKRTLYIEAFLQKAKKEHNYEEIVHGYKNYIPYVPAEMKFSYADSMVNAAKSSKQNTLLGTAYLTKGVVYYGEKDHIRALDHYIIANNFICRTDDLYLQHKVRYAIAQVKYYLGYYEEAFALFTECLNYFKSEEDGAYLDTLHMLALCYNKMGNYGLCSGMNATGLAECHRLHATKMRSYFTHMEGINQWHRQNYTIAIDYISRSLPAIIDRGDFANEATGYFYIGRSYWALGQKEKAIQFLRKADKILEANNYIRPDLREIYELIINYYKANGNNKALLHYVGKLLAADRTLESTFKYLAGKIHKEYDTKKLLTEKQTILNQLKKRERKEVILIYSIVTLFLLLLALAYRYIVNKRRYRKRFEEIMKEKEIAEVASNVVKKEDKAILDINPDAIATVLRMLEKFEKEKKFLEKEWTSVKLAASFNSNTKYLSKIISHYKGKGFVEYLNGLRIDYIIALLKEDRKVRNYSDKALAEEAGFSSTQRFTNAFLAKKGISARYFVDELKKRLAASEEKKEKD